MGRAWHRVPQGSELRAGAEGQLGQQGAKPRFPPAPSLSPVRHGLALTLSLLPQIMIEFCPGGAVDATMLGECSCARGDARWAFPAPPGTRSSPQTDGRHGCHGCPFSPRSLPIFIP